MPTLDESPPTVPVVALLESWMKREVSRRNTVDTQSALLRCGRRPHAAGGPTLLELLRVGGAEAQPYSARTNFGAGVHAGCFILPGTSLAAELRYHPASRRE
jgi:hypothetical protein